MEYNEEIKEQDLTEEMEMENESGSMKQWFQDNLRIIISAVIVIVIAAGIYSYSSRTEVSETVSEETTQENGGLLSETADEESATAGEMAESQTVQDQKTAPQRDEQVSSSTSSRETEQSFVETAIAGDGTTRMARRALANYLEKNPESSLTAEHKIYIEDYMRKNIPQKRVRTGDSVEFQKSLIQNAISQSKNLTQGQLENLHKYALRVPSLT